MGLFDWIGEAIGNAFGALAEFIGDAFSAVFRAVGGMVKGMATDYSKDLVDVMDDPEDDISKRGKHLREQLEEPITGGYLHDFAEAEKRHSPLTRDEAAEEVNNLWTKIQADMGVISTGLFTAEVASLGQIDRLNEVINIADKIGGGTAFAAQVQAMKMQAQYLDMYRRYLYFKSPHLIPGANDIVRFQLREVFDPIRRAELLQEGVGADYLVAMQENGFNITWAENYWAAHWVLPSVGQLNEMLHRGVIEPPDWDRFVRYNDYDPTVRPWLKAISYNPYTRVDVRRMWDLSILNESELLRNYKDLGYDDEHAQNMTLWTKIYILAGDIKDRFKKGWITFDEALQELTSAGMDPDRATTLLETITEATDNEAVGKQRDLTKTDILRSIKKGLITQDDGLERLVDLGYSEDEALFIIESYVSDTIEEEINADRDLSKADIIAGVAKHYFTKEQGLELLQGLGYSEEQATYILEIRVPALTPNNTAVERDLTKAEIVKGVVKAVITWDQGYAMLMDMGYDDYEADFILTINVEASTGSPKVWSEFQDLVNKQQKALGHDVKEIPREIRTLESQIAKLKKVREKGKEANEDRDFFLELDGQLKPLERKLAKLIKSYAGA